MFGHNSKVDLELNREVEKLIKTGGKRKSCRSCRPANRYYASRPSPTTAS